MANRYWVGGTGNWSDNTNHWSATSGGSPGASLPTSSDNVFINSSSGLSGGEITIDEEAYCNNFTSNSGLNYGFGGGISYGIEISGSAVFESGISFDSGLQIYFIANGGNKTITCNGVIFDAINIGGEGTGNVDVWMLQDNLESISGFYHARGTFDANDHNVTANDFYFYADTGYIPTVIMGSGIWEGSEWNIDESNGEVVTITPETSTIKVGGEDKTFYGGGKTYNNIWLNVPNVTDFIRIQQSNTFNDFRISAGVKAVFNAGTTQNISSFTASGNIGNLIILDTWEGTDQFTLSKTSGTVNCDYLNISNSKVEGGAKWYAGAHSLDTTNNDGWSFEKYTRVAKPTGANYTRVNPQGKEEYDSPLLTYDDLNTFYDGVNETAWSGVSKPTGSTWSKVAKPTL